MAIDLGRLAGLQRPRPPTCRRCGRPAARPLWAPWWRRRRSRRTLRRCAAVRCAVPRAACNRDWREARRATPDQLLYQRARDRGALLLAAGQLQRRAVEIRLQLQQLRRLPNAPFDLSARLALHPQRRSDVFIDGERRIIDELLVDHRHRALPHVEAGDVLAVDEHAAGRRLVEASQQPHDRCLARKRRPQQHTERCRAPASATRRGWPERRPTVADMVERDAHVRLPPRAARLRRTAGAASSRRSLRSRRRDSRRPSLERRHTTSSAVQRPLLRHQVPTSASVSVAPNRWPRSAIDLRRRQQLASARAVGVRQPAGVAGVEKRIVARQLRGQRRDRRDIEIAAGQRRLARSSPARLGAAQIGREPLERLLGQAAIGRDLAADRSTAAARRAGLSSSNT